MKKILFAAAALSILITQTGCFGSFSLTRKLYDANDSISNGFLKTLVMYVLLILPAYSGAAFLDIIIFNLIEFWSGDNPLSLAPGETQEQLMTIKGETYKVTATQNKMHFAKISEGKVIDMGAMEFDTKDMAWNFTKDGESHTLATIDVETYAATFNTENGTKTVDVSSIECLALDKLNNTNVSAFAAK